MVAAGPDLVASDGEVRRQGLKPADEGSVDDGGAAVRSCVPVGVSAAHLCTPGRGNRYRTGDGSDHRDLEGVNLLDSIRHEIHGAAPRVTDHEAFALSGSAIRTTDHMGESAGRNLMSNYTYGNQVVFARRDEILDGEQGASFGLRYQVDVSAGWEHFLVERTHCGAI